MPFVDFSPLNYPTNTTEPLLIRRETRPPVDDVDGRKGRLLTLWHDVTNEDVYILVRATTTSSVWKLVASADAIQETFVDVISGPGVNPVVPNALGQITVSGGQVASATIGANVIQTSSSAPATYDIQIQQSGEAAAQDTTLNGVCHFNSSQFNVTNGFVELSGGGLAVDSFTVPAGTSPVVPDANGNIDLPAGNGFQFTGGTNAMTGAMNSPFTGAFTFTGAVTAEGNATLGTSSSATNSSRLRNASGQWDNYDDGTDSFGFYNNAGTPEGVVAANIGSRCVDTTNGALFIKTTDTVNTGWVELGVGNLIQIVSANTTTNSTATTVIPFDNTIPQQTEGDEILTVSITPTDTNNTLLIMFNGKFFQASPTACSLALFQDATANALSATHIVGNSAAGSVRGTGNLIYTMTAGTTSSTTFKIRVGPVAGGGGVGVNSAEFGSAVNTRIVVMEIA